MNLRNSKPKFSALLLLGTLGSAAMADEAVEDKFSPAYAAAYAAKAVQNGDQFWKGDHWAASYGAWIHGSTQMYWNALHAKLGGDRTRFDRIGQHFQFALKHWNPETQTFINRHDYMANAVMAMNMAATLDSAAALLDEPLRVDMESRLRLVCAFLDSRSTSITPLTSDMRATNQDVLAAAAMALAADYFHDSELRGKALKKLREAIGTARGPFITEGGVDKGYQTVGEPGTGLAVDLLWDSLTPEDMRKIADIAMRPYATRGMGLEPGRAESTLAAVDESDMSGLLGRVWHPLVARDIRDSFSIRGLNSGWTLMDTAAVVKNMAILRRMSAIRLLESEPAAVGWGGSGRLIMAKDEYGAENTGDEKTFLASRTGLVALFGDRTQVNPTQLEKKDMISTMPAHWDQGGLRYLSRGHDVFAWSDGRFSYPRLVWGESPASGADLRRVESEALVGFFGSQYRLVQAIADPQGAEIGKVTQHFQVMGDQLVMRFAPDAAVAAVGVRYEMTVPATGHTVGQAGKSISWQQAPIVPELSPASAAVIAISEGGLRFHEDALVPYLVNRPIRIWLDGRKRSVNVKPEMKLSRIEIPLAKEPRWSLFTCGSSPGQIAALEASLQFQEEGGAEVLRYADGDRSYLVVLPKGVPERLEIDTPAGRLALLKPTPGVLQSIGFNGGQIAEYHLSAASADFAGKPLFSAAEVVRVSSAASGGRRFVDINGADVRLDAGAGEAVDLVSGASIDLTQPLTDVRFWQTQQTERN